MDYKFFFDEIKNLPNQIGSDCHFIDLIDFILGEMTE